MLLADYQSYIACQERVSKTYLNQEAWTKMSICNVIRMGKFSSDHAVKTYAEKIWGVEPMSVKIKEYVQGDIGLLSVPGA